MEPAVWYCLVQGFGWIMRSVRLFAVAVLAVILAITLFSPVAAISGITIKKITTNGDTTTQFGFVLSGQVSGAVSGGQLPAGFNLVGGGTYPIYSAPTGDYTVTEVVPSGWVLTKVYCEGTVSLPPYSTFTYIPGGVVIHFVEGDFVICGFTNSPAAPVGGLVMPANTFAILAPWLAVIGLVGCIGTVVVAKKRRP